MTHIQGVILAIVEGLTEYLPISSTGHLIITSALMGINDAPFTKDFTVIVQFGAILSVVVLYWKRFLSGTSFYAKLIVAFLPAAVIGLLVKNKIDALLGSVTVVAFALIAGGVVLVFIDRLFDPKRETQPIESLAPRQAALIGVFQCLAFIPGMSRSASTIVGGLTQRLSRKDAAEFSFLLAVPTLTGATCLKLLKIAKTIQPDQIQIILIGNAISFVVGILTLRLFVGFLSRGGLRIFGYYRIVVGAGILVALMLGHQLSVL